MTFNCLICHHHIRSILTILAQYSLLTFLTCRSYLWSFSYLFKKKKKSYCSSPGHCTGLDGEAFYMIEMKWILGLCLNVIPAPSVQILSTTIHYESVSLLNTNTTRISHYFLLATLYGIATFPLLPTQLVLIWCCFHPWRCIMGHSPSEGPNGKAGKLLLIP